jgi:hypothetical protein
MLFFYFIFLEPAVSKLSFIVTHSFSLASAVTIGHVWRSYVHETNDPPAFVSTSCLHTTSLYKLHRRAARMRPELVRAFTSEKEPSGRAITIVGYPVMLNLHFCA